MSRSRSEIMIGRARQMMPLIEGVFKEEGQFGAALTAKGFSAYRQTLLEPFEGHTLKILATYALDDAQLLATTAAKEVNERLKPTPAELRLLLKANQQLLRPSFMTDAGMAGFENFIKHTTDRRLHIYPGTNGRAWQLSWAGYDFDGYISTNTGCPAHQLPLSTYLPVGEDIEGNVPAPQNFLDQFWRTSIDAALADMNTPY